MTVTTTGLTRAAGVCAAAAGAIFIGVQIKHPHLDATSIQTTEMAVRGTLKMLMAVLALVGIAGFVMPMVAPSDPGSANAVIDATTGRPSSGDIGALATVVHLQDISYLAG